MIIDLKITRADQVRSTYLYVPVDVPEGTTRIDVRLEAKRSDDCQLDLGILDPSIGRFPSETGFRGWSGGARSEFFVATDDATPGYLYGPLPAGRWQVIIGLNRVPMEGTDVRLTIRFDSTPRRVTPPVIERAPVREGAGWYRGDLHCHTFHSDAAGSPEVLHRAARQAGLDFLAVTDHNTISQRSYFSPASTPDLVFVRGMEVTTHCGHANVFGLDDVTDFRITQHGDVQALAESVRSRGGILSINHDKPTIPWNYDLPPAYCMEVWQSTWLEWNWISLDRWQTRLAASLRLSAIGGSDFHQPVELQPEGPQVLARPTTALYLDELSEAAILRGMKAGHGYITESPTGPHLALTAEGNPMGSRLPFLNEARVEVQGAKGDLLAWVGADGVLDEVEIDSDDCMIALARPERARLFLRTEIIAKASHDRLFGNGIADLDDPPMAEQLARELPRQRIRRALSNPIYIGR